MIYHFGDLGYDDSIFTCNNGTINSQSDAITGDCKLDTKPQPQWVENWLGNTARKNIYDDWAKMIDLKINQNVFENGNHSWNFGATGRTRLDIWTSTTATTDLSYVFVLTNMTNAVYAAPAGFPFTGTWYDMIDGTPYVVTNTNMIINIEADGYRVLGNKNPALSTGDYDLLSNVGLYPNPSKGYFSVNIATSKVQVFSITGQLVKQFSDEMSAGAEFNISELNSGMYIVKITDQQNRQKAMKLVKQ
jgi:hypothetical protein